MLARYRSALSREPPYETANNAGSNKGIDLNVNLRELTTSSGTQSNMVSSSQNSKQEDSSRLLLSRI